MGAVWGRYGGGMGGGMGGVLGCDGTWSIGAPIASKSDAPVRDAGVAPATVSSPTALASTSSPVVCEPHSRESSATSHSDTRSRCSLAVGARPRRSRRLCRTPHAIASAASDRSTARRARLVGVPAPVATHSRNRRARCSAPIHTLKVSGSSLLGRFNEQASGAAADVAAADAAAAAAGVAVVVARGLSEGVRRSISAVAEPCARCEFAR